MKHVQTIFTIIIFTMAVVTMGASPTGQSWNIEADVDWDGMLERLRYTPELPGNGVYPWRAFRFTARPVPRVQTGLENLRETVYWKGKRVLDEGYWYGRKFGTSTRYAALYNKKNTFEDPSGTIVTRWESDAAILTRTVTLRHETALFRYRIWMKPADETSITPQGDICMGVVFHSKPETGNVEQSMDYIIKRINRFSHQCPGITHPGLEFSLRYTFDDTMKALHDFHSPVPMPVIVKPAVIGWDGTNPPDFYHQGIAYEDAAFAPGDYLGREDPAIFGIVHPRAKFIPPVDSLTDSSQVSVTTGHLDEQGQWQGLPPCGKYTQLATAVYRSPESQPERFVRGDTNGDEEVDGMDLVRLMAYFLNGSEPACYDAVDVNDDGVLTLEDGFYLGLFLCKPGSPPPSAPFPAPGPDPTPDNIRCGSVEPADPAPPCEAYTLRLNQDPSPGVEKAHYSVHLAYNGDKRATQAHTALRFEGLQFVSAQPASQLPGSWHITAATFPVHSVHGGILGLSLYNTGDVEPPSLDKAKPPHIPAGKIIEITFKRIHNASGVHPERYVGHDNLYWYTGVGMAGNPFIPCTMATGGTSDFRRGDANIDLHVDISDCITLIYYLFRAHNLKCMDAADANDSGSINIADPVFLLSYLFGGGDPPPPPYPGIGPDPTLDKLDCRYYPTYQPVD